MPKLSAELYVEVTRLAAASPDVVKAFAEFATDLVLGLFGAGMSNAEIARHIHVVEGTVKVYVSAIFKQLDVRNRVQAAILAYEAGLILRRR